MDKKRTRRTLQNLIERLLQIVGYAVTPVFLAIFSDTFSIDDNHLYLYGFTATLIIFFLNKTIKPILFFLTIPITGVTIGVFYPCINLFILKLTDWILREHFQIKNIFIAFLLAILISVMNQLVENIITKPIMRRIKKNG